MQSHRQQTEIFAKFAENEINGHDNYHEMTLFPEKLWQKMKHQKLFGVGVEKTYGGHGGDSRAISLAGSVLTAHGGNLGIAMTWMMHELTARWLIARFGNQNQKNEFLPKMARGDITVCFAASEPNTGAHPKWMRTTATPITGRYRISGEKTFLTNGPLADLFVVITAIGAHEGKKDFSAFLIPKHTPGLLLTDPIPLPILKPCPHCGIILTDCMVENHWLLGPPGNAYEAIVKPFREIEDVMLMGPVSGGLRFQLNRLKKFIRQRKIRLNTDEAFELGSLSCEADAMFALAMTAAEKIETLEEYSLAIPLSLYFRQQVQAFQKRIKILMEKFNAENDFLLSCMTTDITGGIHIAGNVAKLKIQRIGESFMTPGRSI